MPFTLLQVGSTLKSVNTDGGLSSALTLPTGVTLAVNLQPRFARFKNYVVVVNTPSRPLSVDTSGVVRNLTPVPPVSAVVLTAGAAGTLTGSYLALQTYRLLDSAGNIIAESDYSPAMAARFSVGAQKLHAAFPVSAETVDGTQLYRTATNGGTYFTWAAVTGNTTTFVENDTADASLGLIAAPSLGTAPDLTLIAEFGGRLWGVSRTDVNSLRYTEAGTMYGWSALNTLLIPHVGSDDAGITALIPRRAALGVSRRTVFSQVTGSLRTNIAPVVVNGGEQVGCVSQESVVVFNDVAFFLAFDGVYRWDSRGISCVTNNRVREWFTTDTVFNRSMFWRAAAMLDQRAMKYRLFLASKGSAVLDRWIEIDLLNGSVWGPHLTDAFTPTSCVIVAGRNQQPYAMIGSQEGYLSQDQENKNDWGLMAIRSSAQTTELGADDPAPEKYFGELTVFTEKQTSGTLTVTPVLGPKDEEVDQTPFSHAMTRGRRRLGRIGSGESLTLKFDHNTINEDVVLQGFEIDPVHSIGQR